MATSVLPISQAPSQPVTTAATTQSKKFLDHCVEELNPDTIKPYDHQSTLWKVAAVATLVVYTVLSVAAFIATGIFAPVYIPVAGICALLLLDTSYQFYEKFQHYAQAAAQRSAQMNEIKHNYEALATKTPENLQRILYDMGIIWFNIPDMLQNPANLETLKPLIARHEFWKGHMQHLETKKQELLQEAQALSQDYDTSRNMIYNLRAGALELDKTLLESKVKDAFVLAAIRNPALTGGLANIGDFSKLSNQERILGNAINDPSVNNLFTFKNNAIVALTVDEVKNSNVALLSQRILAGAAA